MNNSWNRGSAREVTQPEHLFLGDVRDIEKLAAVRERDPRITYSGVMFAFFSVVRFFCKCRHSGGRLPSGFVLLHLTASRVSRTLSETTIQARLINCYSTLVVSRKIGPPKRGQGQKDVVRG